MRPYVSSPFPVFIRVYGNRTVSPLNAAAVEGLQAQVGFGGGFEIEQVLEDIESLNRRALEGQLEVSAVSIHAYAHLTERYALMPCGASMGDGYGPRIVARETIEPSTIASGDSGSSPTLCNWNSPDFFCLSKKQSSNKVLVRK